MIGEPTVDQVHINVPLSTYAVQRFYFSSYVSDLIAPPVAVPNVSGNYFVIDPRQGTSQDYERELMPGDVAPEFNFTIEKGSYACILEALRHLLPDVTDAVADAAVKERLRGIDQIINNLAIKREVKIHSRLTSYSSYPGGQAGDHIITADTGWDQPTSDPKVDIDAAVRQVEQACGMTPNVLLCSPKTYDILTRNQEIRDLIRYNPARANQYILDGSIGDRIFRLQLVDAAGVYNQNAPLMDVNMGYIWERDSDLGDDYAIVMYRDPSPSRYTAGAMVQFVYNMNQAAPGLMGRLRVYRDEPREGTWYEFRTQVEPVLTNNLAIAAIVGTETAGSP